MTIDKKDNAPDAPKPGSTGSTSSGSTSSTDSSANKRPHATLDLKAIEVVAPTPKTHPTATGSATASPSSASAQASSAKPADKAADVKNTEAAKPAVEASKPKADPARPATPAPTAPKPVKSGGGIGSTLSHLTAGLLGGFVAWYGAPMLAPQLSSLGLPELPVASSSANKQVETKLTALEKAIAERSGTTAPSPELAAKLSAAESRLAKLEDLGKSIDKLSDSQAKLAADNQATLDALAKQSAQQLAPDSPAARLAKLEARLQLMSDAATSDPQAGKLPQLAAITGRVVDLEATLNAQLSAVRKTVSQELESRLSLTNETSEAAKSGTNRIDRDMAAVKTEAAAVAQKLATLKSDSDRLTTAVQGIRDDSNAMKTALDAVRSDIDAKYKASAKPADVASAVGAVAGKLTTLEQNVQNVVKSEADRKTNAERIVLALELNNLKRVLDRGQKYATELAEVKKAAAGTNADLSILERYKDSGIATVAELTNEFRPVANAILDADAQPVEGSVLDRMLARAKSVVRIRKVNATADDKSAAAVVTRMELALKEARIIDVLNESKGIPPKASAAAQGWLVKVEGRAAVDRAIASLETALKTSIAGAPIAPAAPPAEKPTK